MTHPYDDHPEWVLLGVPYLGGKVAILASKELDEAELRQETELDERYWWNPHLPPSILRKQIFLTVEMRTYVIVIADTYAEALAHLLREWTPDRAEQDAIEGRKALPHGA